MQLISKALGYQTSEFATNHRYIADALVSESMANTSGGAHPNQNRYSCRLPNRSWCTSRIKVRHALSSVSDSITAIVQCFGTIQCRCCVICRSMCIRQVRAVKCHKQSHIKMDLSHCLYLLATAAVVEAHRTP